MLEQASECLAEDTLHAFITGQLSAAELARVDEHLGGCEACIALVAVAVGVALEGTARSEEDISELFGGGTLPAASPKTDSYRLALAERRIGDVLRGKYRLESVLGVGGMAAVYRATHRNQASYAIKMLLPELALNSDIRRRFLREGYAANSVKHEGALAVIDDDVAEDGSAFLVLELLDGIAGDQLWQCLGKHLPADAVTAIALKTLEVLAAAHDRNIVHRDIKPANLFIERSGKLKVLDFGVAHIRATLSDTFSTATGVLVGTPAFMAPEQALRKPSEIDGRADIWALGATAFTLLSGRRVHEGDSPHALLSQLVTRPARSLAQAAPDVARELVEVIDRALLLQPSARWQSAGQMAEAMARAAQALWGQIPTSERLAALVTEALNSSEAEQARLPQQLLVAAHTSHAVLTSTLSAERAAAPPGAATLQPSEQAASARRTTARRAPSAWVFYGLGASVATATLIALLVRNERPAAEEPRTVVAKEEPAMPTSEAALRAPEGSPTAGPASSRTNLAPSASNATRSGENAEAATPRERSEAGDSLVLTNPADAQRLTSAEALFDEGRKLLAKKRYREACERFEQSQAVDPGVGTSLYLGDCYEHDHRLASAWAAFRGAASIALATNQYERAVVAERRLAKIETGLAKIRLLIPPQPPGFGLSMDRKPLAPQLANVPLPIDHGEHSIVASAPGYESWSTVAHVTKVKERLTIAIPRLSPARSQ